MKRVTAFVLVALPLLLVLASGPGAAQQAAGNGQGAWSEPAAASEPVAAVKTTVVLKAELKTVIINQAVAQKLPELAAELRQKAKIEVLK